MFVNVSHPYNRTHYIPRHRTVRYIPDNHVRLALNGLTFYYSSGIFYRTVDNYYQEVEAPVGAIVYELPYYAEKIWIDGQVYYQYENTLFAQINTNRGWAFKVAGQLTWE